MSATWRDFASLVYKICLDLNVHITEYMVNRLLCENGGLAKQRKERSFRKRKFCLRKEGFDIHLIVNTSSNS